jgi:hypothetical protein
LQSLANIQGHPDRTAVGQDQRHAPYSRAERRVEPGSGIILGHVDRMEVEVEARPVSVGDFLFQRWPLAPLVSSGGGKSGQLTLLPLLMFC